MNTSSDIETLPLGVIVCGNCKLDQPNAEWQRIEEEIIPRKGGLHFHHWRLDVEPGNWWCPRCKAVNTVEDDGLTESVGPYCIEALVFGSNTEHGEYFYPEFVVRMGHELIAHEGVQVGQFDLYEPEPAIEAALKAGRAYVSELLGKV
jgi:hypothetical protein